MKSILILIGLLFFSPNLIIQFIALIFSPLFAICLFMAYYEDATKRN